MEEDIMKEIDVCIDRLNKTFTKMDALNKVFATIVDRKNVQLTIITVLHILKYNLEVDVDNLYQNELHLCLPLIKTVIFYIYAWPGWKNSEAYYSNKISYKKWYKEFCEYLHKKIHYVYNGYARYLAMDKGSDDVDEVLYTLELTAPVDNFDFKFEKNNLVVHPTGCISVNTDFGSLLNMPYMSIEVKLPQLHITRKCVHDIKRYIVKKKPAFAIMEGSESSCADVMPINSAQKGNESCEFDKLKTCFNNILTWFESQQLTSDSLETIFSQFLQDLNNCINNKGMLPTNIYFTFKLGNSTFIRTISEIKENSKSTIYVVEEITPKIQFGLHSINLNDATLQESSMALANCFLLTCTQCNIQFVGNAFRKSAILHYKNVHPFGGVVKCEKCNLNQTYYSLSKFRWTHKCI